MKKKRFNWNNPITWKQNIIACLICSMIFGIWAIYDVIQAKNWRIEHLESELDIEKTIKD